MQLKAAYATHATKEQVQLFSQVGPQPRPQASLFWTSRPCLFLAEAQFGRWLQALARVRKRNGSPLKVLAQLQEARKAILF